MAGRTQIKGTQIKDESITEDDIKDGSIKAAELNTDAITGHDLHTGNPDEANDMLLMYDQSANSLKKIPISDIAGSGGGATSNGLFVTGHVDLTTNNKPVNWVNASNISASSGIKSWFIVPNDMIIDKIIISVKGNNFSTSNDGDVTLSIYKNQQDYGTTVISQTVGADTFSEKVSNMAGGTTDCNQKIFPNLNLSVAEGDLIHVKVGKSIGSDKEGLVTMVFDSGAGSATTNKTGYMARASAIPATGGQPWIFSFGDGEGNSGTTSDANNKDTMLIVPHDGTIKELLLTVHQSMFQSSTYGNITLTVYKNSVEFDSGSKLIELTTGADTFTGKNRLINMQFTYFARQKDFADLFGSNVYSVSKGDIIQVGINGSTSTSFSNLDITLSLLLEET